MRRRKTCSHGHSEFLPNLVSPWGDKNIREWAVFLHTGCIKVVIDYLKHHDSVWIYCGTVLSLLKDVHQEMIALDHDANCAMLHAALHSCTRSLANSHLRLLSSTLLKIIADPFLSTLVSPSNGSGK